MSTPPKVRTTASKAARTAAHRSRRRRRRAPCDGFRDRPCRSVIAIQHGHFRAGPRSAFAVAAPMPEPPPVTIATWRASTFSAALPSLACSSDQYSMSNISASEIGSIAADRFGVGDHRDGVFGDIGRDGGVLRRGAEPEQAHALHRESRAAADRAPFFSVRRAHCCEQNRRDSGRHIARPRLRLAPSRRRACPRPAPAPAAASSWCGWCGRG